MDSHWTHAFNGESLDRGLQWTVIGHMPLKESLDRGLHWTVIGHMPSMVSLWIEAFNGPTPSWEPSHIGIFAMVATLS